MFAPLHWWITVRLGAKNLLLHRLRSVLTVLGVVLGVGSVIAMLAVGEGSKREALEQIRQLGAANVIIRSVKPSQHSDQTEETSAAAQQKLSRVVEYGLKHADYERLLVTLPTVERSLPIALVRKDAQHEHRRIANANILGTTPDCLYVKNLHVRSGRFLTVPDLETTANVAVLGAGAAERLFSFEDPIGRPLLLGPDAYRVIGVLDPVGNVGAMNSGFGQHDLHNSIFIPLSAARQRFGELQVIRGAGSLDIERTQLNEITLQVNDPSLVTTTAAMARRLLEPEHSKSDFEIQVPLELLRRAEQEKRIWNLVLGSIAGISLVVGGVGIMNIMLASVTERTREIGIRRALGAKRRDITLQFLVESVVLSSTGGLLGIVVGVTIPRVVTHLAKIETIVSWWSVLLAFGISAVTGVIFGIYPARRAAHMDPIQALRHV